MQIIIWIAVAVILGTDGSKTIVHDDNVYASKKDCEVVQTKVRSFLSDHSEVKAFGLSCVPITVNDKGPLKPAGPSSEPGPRRLDAKK